MTSSPLGDSRPPQLTFSSAVSLLSVQLSMAARPGGVRVLFGLAGVPGSGKTTAAAALAAAAAAAAGAPAASVAVLSADGFHLPRSALALGVAGRSAEESFARRGAPWTFDSGALVSALAAVAADEGAAIAWPGFDHAVGDPAPGAILVPPTARLVLLEGLYLLHGGDGWSGVLPLLRGGVLFLDTPPHDAAARLLARHQAAWGISREAAQARIDSNDGPNGELVRGTASRAAALLAVEEGEPQAVLAALTAAAADAPEQQHSS